MATKRKGSLVDNINRRKRAKTSRSKVRSTISADAYQEMRKGWTGSKSGRRKPGSKKKSR